MTVYERNQKLWNQITTSPGIYDRDNLVSINELADMELDISVRAKEKNLKAHQVVRERTYDLQFLKKSLKMETEFHWKIVMKM